MDAETTEFVLRLQRECKKQTEHYVRLAEKKLGVYIPVPQIVFSQLGTTAGRAHWPKMVIEYNPRIMRLNSEDFLVKTTGHEVAHLVAFELHKKTGIIKAHGMEWTKVMWAFGLQANRCHNYDTGNGRAPRKTASEYETLDGRKIVETRGAKVITFD